MSYERFFIEQTLHSDATGPFTCNDADGNAYVSATGITLTDHTGKMVLVTDTGGKRAWGVLSSLVDGSNVFVESIPLAQDMTFSEVEASFNDAAVASVAIVITNSPSIDVQPSTVLEQIRTPFEGGYVQSRPMHTRARDLYDISWRGLTTTELGLYLDFFKANQGTIFMMTKPIFNTVFLARFASDSIKWTPLTPDRFEFEASFEEA